MQYFIESKEYSALYLAVWRILTSKNLIKIYLDYFYILLNYGVLMSYLKINYKINHFWKNYNKREKLKAEIIYLRSVSETTRLRSAG